MAFCLIAPSCGGSENTAARNTSIVNAGKNADEAYEMLHVAFEGEPSIESIRKLIEPVMKQHGVEINYENLIEQDRR